MSAVFMCCAVVGGTILICQLVLSLVGFGGHDLHLGGEALAGDHGSGGLEEHAASPDGHDAAGQHGSTWLFSVVSFRTLVAASTFFGLGGLLAESLHAQRWLQFAVGGGMGFGAMVGVHKLMGLFYKLSEDGTVRIQRAVGLDGTVYIPIPANKTGTGKIHLNLQNRLMEYPAVTANRELLATGAKVVVVGVLGENTLEVSPAPAPAENHAA